MATHQVVGRMYKEQELVTAPRERVIAYLFDGLRSFVEQGKVALSKSDVGKAGEKLGRAQAIVWELLGSLNMEQGGEIAQSLARIYRFMIDRLVEANLAKDSGPLDDVLRVLSEIQEGWNGLLSQKKIS